MKKSLLFLLALVISLGTMAQVKPIFHKVQKDFKVERPTYRHDGTVVGESNPNVYVSNKATLEDPTLLQTVYDLQSNCNAPRHLYVHPDGTIGGVGTWSNNESGYPDRGTGYNYFNGTSWGSMPTARLESVRTGWPNYQPFGPNGEIVVSHQSGTLGLVVSTRATKGTGAWTDVILPAPSGAAGMLWPRMVTSGPDHTNIHIIALTSPTGNGGTVYNGMDGALLYNRSLDGGVSWEGWEQLDGMTSSEYINISADNYEFANPVGDNIAFVYGDNFRDFAIMKSTDNGATWTQTIIWPCPYNLWAGGDTTGTFWCGDGHVWASIDNNGTVHALTGLQRASGDEAGATFWYPFTDGLLYWNENMPTWDPVLDPDVLYENGNYIGWCPDTMVFYNQAEQLAYYYNSMSSFPTMTIDDEGNIYAMWSSVTMLLDPDNYMLRHLFRRSWDATAQAWGEEITDLTSDFLYTWTECVYATASPTTTTDKVHVLFMGDELAGVKLKGDNGAQGQTTITTNSFIYLTTPTYVGIDEPGAKATFALMQNYPNPVQGTTDVKVVTANAANLSLDVTNMVGQTVMQVNKGNVAAGNHHFTLDCSSLPSGVYFYTVKVGKETATRKMIVQ